MSLQQIKDPKKLTEIAKEAVIKYTDQIEINRQLQADNAALREELERERVRLAACGVAAMQNTKNSIKERIDSDNKYCSQSYIDVCTAVDREIAIREKLARLVKAAKHYIITPDADEITKRLALHDLRVCLSGVEDEDNG